MLQQYFTPRTDQAKILCNHKPAETSTLNVGINFIQHYANCTIATSEFIMEEDIKTDCTLGPDCTCKPTITTRYGTTCEKEIVLKDFSKNSTNLCENKLDVATQLHQQIIINQHVATIFYSSHFCSDPDFFQKLMCLDLLFFIKKLLIYMILIFQDLNT